MQETRVQSLGWEDPLEKEMATHSSILAWRIPWTEEPGGFSPWGHKGGDMTEHTHITSPQLQGWSRARLIIQNPVLLILSSTCVTWLFSEAGALGGN